MDKEGVELLGHHLPRVRLTRLEVIRSVTLAGHIHRCEQTQGRGKTVWGPCMTRQQTVMHPIVTVCLTWVAVTALSTIVLSTIHSTVTSECMREIHSSLSSSVLPLNAVQGTLILMPLLPYGLAEHIYGSDALRFKPQRWLPTAAAAPLHDAAQVAAPAGPAADSSSTAATPATPATPSDESAALGGSASTTLASASGSAPSAGVIGGSKGASTAAPPDPLTFMTGQRDW